MKRVYILILLCSAVHGIAQQVPLVGGMLALQFSNPAVASADNRIQASVTHKQSWTLPDAPKVSGVSFHMPFSFNRFGWGVSVLQESAFALQKNFIAGDFSYKIKLKEKSFLAAGIRLGISQMSQRIDPGLIRDDDDPLAGSTWWNPSTGVGLNLNFPKGNISADVNMFSGLYSGVGINPKAYYSLSAHRRAGKGKWIFEPFAQLRYTEGFKPVLSGWLALEWKRLVYLGAGGRTTGIVSPVFGLNVFAFTGMDASLRYYYEYNISKVLPGNNGHEIQILLRLRKAEPITSIRTRKATVSPLQFE